MSEVKAIDALGNEIEVGKYYGYAANRNAVDTISIGKAVKVTGNLAHTKRVTIECIVVVAGFQGSYTDYLNKQKPKISVKSNMVFPVDVEKVNLITK